MAKFDTEVVSPTYPGTKGEFYSIEQDEDYICVCTSDVETGAVRLTLDDAIQFQAYLSQAIDSLKASV